MTQATELERLALNLRVEAELLHTLDLLSALPVVTFKGPALSRMIYGDLRARVSTDNDLYVASTEVAEVLERLALAGYRTACGQAPRLLLEEVGQVALWPTQGYAGVSVDLHRTPFSKKFFRVDDSLIQSNCMKLEIQGRSVSTFAPELAFIHMLSHSLAHFMPAEHRPTLRDAFARLALPERRDKIREVARSSSGLAALRFALLWAEVPEEEWSAVWGASRLRERLLAQLARSSSYFARKLAVAVLLCSPYALRQFSSVLFPSQLLLRSRYPERGPLSARCIYLLEMIRDFGREHR